MSSSFPDTWYGLTSCLGAVTDGQCGVQPGRIRRLCRPRRTTARSVERPLHASETGTIHKLCVSLLRNQRAPFHVKRRRWVLGCPRLYPQGAQAFYVVFHVKRQGLWITSVDNFGDRLGVGDGDVDLRVWGG
jgi:hypothetical protein